MTLHRFWIKRLIRLAIPLACMDVAFAFVGGKFQPAGLVAAICLSLATVALVAWISDLVQLRKPRHALTLRLRAHGLTIDNGIAVKRHDWSEYRSCRVTGRYLVLTSTFGQPLSIPLRAAGNHVEAEELVGFVQRHIRVDVRPTPSL
jgi:hypothetical protein